MEFVYIVRRKAKEKVDGLAEEATREPSAQFFKYLEALLMGRLAAAEQSSGLQRCSEHRGQHQCSSLLL
eukprot:236086-Amphidinium_carterae.1